MASIFDKLVGKQLITDYPGFLKNNIHYEAMVGSIAYGVSSDTSDIDVYGFCMPPRNILFPYQNGKIYGFGKPPKAFNQFQKHHIMDHDSGKEYDVAIYNIVRFFQLCMEANPNMVDSLFVPQRCILSCTQLGEYVRENRRIFLSKRCWHKFKGYAFSQLSKMNDKASKEFVELCTRNYWPLDISWEQASRETDDDYVKNLFKRVDQSGKRSKRLPSIKKYGYDVKFAYNVVRLLEEVHMILEEGDLDLTRSREMLKAIRKGEWSIEQVNEFFDHKYKVLENVYNNSDLPMFPREDEIGKVLNECIYLHYGDLKGSSKISIDNSVQNLVLSLQDDINRLANLLK